MDLHDALAQFLQQAEANGRSSHTICQFARHVALLGSWAQQEGLGRDLAAFDHNALARFLASPVAKGTARGGARKASSANALRSSLRTFFRYLHVAGMIEKDPSLLMKRARVGPGLPRGLTSADRERLLGVLAAETGPEAQRDRVLFALMLGTGVRIGSALALDIEDLDLGDGRIRLRQLKNGGEASVFVPGTLRVELAELVADRKSGPVFLARGSRRVTMRQVQRRLDEWLQKAGIQGAYSPHSLRHTFATELYRKTRDVGLVQAALGHASITSTMVYAKVDQQAVREAIGAA